LTEALISQALSHPNIVRFEEVGEADGILYLAMELINGPDVGAMIRQEGAMAVRTAIRILCQALSGLAHAHSEGYVHRDIKPENILIAQQRYKKVARLADFGLARVYESSQVSGLTVQGEVSGTPAYMAPEQATHYREVTPAADQYAAAATLYKMLTAKTAHDLPTKVAEQIAHIVVEDAIPIRTRRSDVPKELAAVIHRALSRDAQERYPDVLTFRTELKRFA
jgi:serine/threonine-protein kinase